MTATPSAEACTSVSMCVAPALRAFRNARSVFSGASIARPRWAMTRGRGDSKNDGAPSGTRPTRGPTTREAGRDALERLGQLRRDDPQLAGLTLRDLRQRLQVLVGEEGPVRVPLMDRLEDRRDRLRFTLGAQHRRLGLTLSRQDRRLARTLGLEDRRLLGSLSRQDLRAAVALGAHLLLHRVLDREGRVDRLELDTSDADAPLAGGLVEHDPKLAVDVVAARQRLLEVEATDHVAERRGRQLLDCAEVVRDLVGRGTGIRHLEVDDRVDRDDEVVLRDDRLGDRKSVV